MHSYLQVVKAVVSSLVNDEGEPMFHRKWNHDFIDLPVVKGQHQPTLKPEEIEKIIAMARGWYRVLAEMLRRYIGGRSSGFIFGTRNGGPIIQRNVLRMLHSILAKEGMPKLGFHAFRRYRVTHLRKNLAPEDLIKFWVGHAPQTVTDVYSKLKADVRFRQSVAMKVGLGFELEHNLCAVHPVAPQISTAIGLQVVEKMARPERFELPTF